MNRERMMKLADFVEASTTFDMRRFDYCGTPACIGGHAIALAEQEGTTFDKDPPDSDTDKAAEYLGLNCPEAERLFFPYSDEVSLNAPKGDPRYIDNHRAAESLRLSAEAGKIVWVRE